MKKYLFSQYLFVFIRNIFGLSLIPLLDPQQLGIYKIFCNITNNARFLHFGIPTYSVFRCTSKNAVMVSSYERLMRFVNILSLILIIPYALLLVTLYDLLDLAFFLALILQIIVILINNLLSALERIKGNLLIYSFLVFSPHIALILNPILYFFVTDINFSTILLIYSLINSFVALSLLRIRWHIIKSLFKNSKLKIKFFFKVLKKSFLQILFTILFSLNVLFDNYLLLENYSLAFLGSYSIYLVYNSLFSQLYSGYTVYSFKHANNLYQTSNLALIKNLILLALIGVSFSFIISSLAIYCLGFFPEYTFAPILIENFWWVTGIMIFRFNLPNYYFKNNASNRLVLIFIFLLMLKVLFVIYFDAPIYVIVVLFEPLLSLFILFDYLIMQKRGS